MNATQSPVLARMMAQTLANIAHINGTPSPHGNKKIYGFCNNAAFNRRAEGDCYYFPTRARRDEALASYRASAIAQGLSMSAAIAGIYPVSCRYSDLGESDSYSCK